MCGICGAVAEGGRLPLDEGALIGMRDALTHRGPDDEGAHLAPGVALGSRRLAILDLSEHGAMPMTTPDGRYTIVYNGEVYNYRELRPELEAKGYRFRSGTDTEVLLYLFAEEGPEMLRRLNGMFAIAVWDAVERRLFLARDRLGIKPLFYARAGDSLLFASEPKSLFAAGVTPRFDPARWEELLCFRFVAGEDTPFAGVDRLLPGHYLEWREGEVRTRRWWNLAERALELRESPPRDPAGWFRETFDDAVRLRLISDVPVGVLLSGGLDSSSVAASLSLQAGGGVASFTVGFRERAYDEGPLAQQVADRWGLSHHTLQVSPGELLGGLRRAATINDEPLVHANELHILEIARYAKDHVTVLLSGEGSDEVLGGYVRYQPLRYRALLDVARPLVHRAGGLPRLGGRLRKLGRFLDLESWDRFVLYNSCDVLPGELTRLGMRPRAEFPYRERVLAEARGLHPGDLVRQAMYSDQHTFLASLLDRNDRMTMGASIECRVPFLDYRLVEGLAALPSSALLSGRRSKALLRDAVGFRLPRAIQRHRKWGFGVPWGSYFREVPEIRGLIEALPESEPVRDGPFEPRLVRSVVDAFLRGDDAQQALVRQLLMVTLWYQTCVDGAPGDAAEPLALRRA